MTDKFNDTIHRWPDNAEAHFVSSRLTPEDDGLPEAVVQSARAIVHAVASSGDDALIEYTSRFDGVDLTPDTLRVRAETIEASAAEAPAALREAIDDAIRRVRAFHAPQKPQGYAIDGGGGSRLEYMWRPVQGAALYVPGGRAAYPSTVIMNAVPAQTAGVERIAVLTVPNMVESNPAVAYAIQQLGLTEVYRVAGAQSIAAVAYGTDTIPPVDVIVGPGNAYVAAAKREVYGRVGIDSIAGPSEVLILADDSANPRWVAQDLIAQAEHDPLARCVLASTSEQFLRATLLELEAQLQDEPRREIISEAWQDHGLVLLAEDVSGLIDLNNRMAPEHLQVILRDAPDPARLTAGAIFVGNHAPTAIGDYIAGPNHVLPTGGTARFAGPLGVHIFMRPTSVIHSTEEGTRAIAGRGAEIADYEELHGHALALRLRADDSSNR